MISISYVFKTVTDTRVTVTPVTVNENDKIFKLMCFLKHRFMYIVFFLLKVAIINRL